MNRKVLALLAILSTGLFGFNAAAVLTELRFSEAQMPLGTSGSLVSLSGGEYVAYGITTLNTYRYNDSRDPFSDGGENFGGTNPWGLALGAGGGPARIDLLSPTTFLQVDWFTLAGTLFLDVYDTGGGNIHTFSGSGDGTETINAPNISYFTWHDSGGFVAVSNLRFEAVPEPGSLCLLLMGLSILAFNGGLRKRR